MSPAISGGARAGKVENFAAAAPAEQPPERESAPQVAGPGAVASAPRILLVGPLPPPAHGGAVATEYVLRAPLASRLQLLHVDTSDRRGLDNLGRLDVQNVWLALRHGLAFVRELVATRPRVVLVPVAQNRLGYLRDCLFLVPALLARRAVVVHVHAGGFSSFHEKSDPITRALVRFTMKRVRRAIVLGECLRSTVRGLVPEDRVVVVPNGIADPFDGQPPRRPARPTCTVLYLGTLMEAKGFLDVLAVAKRLASEDSPLRFVFAGAFYRSEDERRARVMLEGSHARVEFTGPVNLERKVELLRDADVFVFPTRYENEAHPYVVLEAMSAGLPVITTARAALAETVVDGESGVFVPAGDVATLSEQIVRLAEDPALRQQLGNAARDRFERMYGLSRWSEQMEAVLRAAAQW